jgi:methylmalonyl-CoA/ethylmalonyl-CoA epimerase
VASPSIVFDHIAIALERIAEASPVLVGALGGVLEGSRAARDFSWACWRFAGGGRIEVLEPRGDVGFVHRFLTQRGPGIHHVTFKVPSLRDACRRAESLGYDIVGLDESRPDWKEAFLHPKQALGIVVQLAEESRAGESPQGATAPPGPGSPPPAVRILGLRLRARAPDRARVQWAGVVQGEERTGEPENGALVYRWPGSPMRIVVDIDPAADEGPVAVEFTADRPVRWPAGSHPALHGILAGRER